MALETQGITDSGIYFCDAHFALLDIEEYTIPMNIKLYKCVACNEWANHKTGRGPWFVQRIIEQLVAQTSGQRTDDPGASRNAEA